MKRLAIYAHYDSRDEVKPFTRHFLRCLADHCERVDFVSTARLSSAELDKVAPHCERRFTRDNVGYDFGMWQHALRDVDLTAWDELIITNSSVFGPIFPFSEMFDHMDRQQLDFWGATDNCDIDWHLQSYFVAFRRKVLCSPSFTQFWRSVLPYENKHQVIRSYEVGMSQFLLQQGFVGDAYVPVRTLFPPWPFNLRHKRRRHDATIWNPVRLLRRRMPFVKVALLRDNPGEQKLEPVYDFMQRAGYDSSLIELDARPAPNKLDEMLHKIRRRP